MVGWSWEFDGLNISDFFVQAESWKARTPLDTLGHSNRNLMFILQRFYGEIKTFPEKNNILKEKITKVFNYIYSITVPSFQYEELRVLVDWLVAFSRLMLQKLRLLQQKLQLQLLNWRNLASKKRFQRLPNKTFRLSKHFQTILVLDKLIGWEEWTFFIYSFLWGFCTQLNRPFKGPLIQYHSICQGQSNAINSIHS